MTVATDEEYANAVFEIAAQAQQQHGEFLPFILPNEDGDCVEFFVLSNDYYAKRVDDYLTLYLDEETEEVVGFVIKNITRILRRVATQQAVYSFVIREGEMCLHALFAAMFSGGEPRVHHIREYDIVADIAWRNNFDKVRIPSILEKANVPNTAPETISA